MTIYEVIEFYIFMMGFGGVLGLFWVLIFSFPKWD